MDEQDPDEQHPGEQVGASAGAGLLSACGLAYVGLGIVLGLAYLVGGVRSSLFPTGWILPAVLIVSGALMTARRRFDIVATLWAGLVLAVFLLDAMIYMRTLERFLDDPAAFDATVIVGALGLLPLVLRSRFRD